MLGEAIYIVVKDSNGLGEWQGCWSCKISERRIGEIGAESDGRDQGAIYLEVVVVDIGTRSLTGIGLR